MTKEHVVAELAQRSRDDWARYTAYRGPVAITAHDQKVEKVRRRIESLGGDPRSFDVLVGVFITLEELPPAFGKAHRYVGTVFQTLLGFVAELVEGAGDEEKARRLFALLDDGASRPTTDG